MPAIIDSAPDCVVHGLGAKPADDTADFIVQEPFKDCTGFMTFGHGSTYGDGGTAATTQYYVLTWIGIAVMVAVFLAWVLLENRTLLSYALKNPLGGGDDGVPPQPSPRI